MRRVIWPVRPGAVVVIATTALVSAALVLLPVYDWQPASWGRLESTWRERGLITAILLGVVAAWAGRALRSGNIVYSAAASRERREIVSAFLVRLVMAAAAGLLVALLAAVLWTALRGAPDAVSVLAVVATLVGVLCAVPIGFALGAVLPRLGWPLVVAAIVALVLILPLIINESFLLNTGLASRSLSLMWGLALPEPGLVTTTTVSFLRLTFFIVLAVAVCMASTASTVRSGRGATVRAAAVLAVPLAMIGLVTVASPQLHLIEPDGRAPLCERVTTAQAGAQICVHKVHADLLPDVTELSSDMLALVPAAPFDVIAEEGVVSASPELTLALSARLPSNRAQYRASVAETLGAALTGQAVCLDRIYSLPNDSPDMGPTNAGLLDDGVRQRLVAAAGIAPAPVATSDDTGLPILSASYERLAQLSDEEFATWYAEHQNQIRDCTLTETDFP